MNERIHSEREDKKWKKQFPSATSRPRIQHSINNHNNNNIETDEQQQQQQQPN